jgi:hypothetical protein
LSASTHQQLAERRAQNGEIVIPANAGIHWVTAVYAMKFHRAAASK